MDIIEIDYKITTIKISFNITDLTNDPLEDYNCNICLENIYKKELYQCKEGHIACLSCWIKILNKNQECMECRMKIKSISKLSRARFIEQQFSKKVVKCPFSFKNIYCFETNEDLLVSDSDNGCNQSITIENLEHHLSNCDHRFLKCNNVGCDVAIRKNKFDKHQEICDYKLLECQYCIKPIAKYLHLQHYDQCPSVSIKCPSCDSNLKRSELNQHIENQCENTIIKCKYFKYGCNQYQIKRKELNQHLIDIDHTIEIDKRLEELNKKISELNIINKFLLQFGNIYKNKWIIENYPNLSLSQNEFKSPIFKIGDFEFQLEFIKIKSIFSSFIKIIFNCLKSLPIPYIFSIELSNHLNNEKSNRFLNHRDLGKDIIFFNDPYTRENGWLNSDNSLIFKFSILFNEEENLIPKFFLKNK